MSTHERIDQLELQLVTVLQRQEECEARLAQTADRLNRLEGFVNRLLSLAGVTAEEFDDKKNLWQYTELLVRQIRLRQN
jgi:hypothetical protein